MLLKRLRLRGEVGELVLIAHQSGFAVVGSRSQVPEFGRRSCSCPNFTTP